jgi:diacylglycerol kinase (ATP)
VGNGLRRPVHKIPVIFNPKARSAKAADRLAAIRQFSDRMELCATEGPGSAERIARRLALAGNPIVVAAGGDGTVNEVANGLLSLTREGGEVPTLGVLPFGTMNVLALEMDLPKADPAACWALIQQGRAREIDVWDLNGRAFLQLAGIGLDAAIISATTWERKKQFGPLSYVLAASKLLGRIKEELVVHVAGRDPLRGKAVLLGSGRHYGGPIKVFPQANNSDGLLDLVVMEHDRLWPLLKGLGGMYLSQGKDLPAGMHYLQVSSVDIEAATPVATEVDGELAASSTHIHITKRPSKLRVICGG